MGRHHYIAFSILLFATNAQAQTAATSPGGFSAEINGTETFSYDSNPLRSPTNARAIWGSTTSPELVLRNKTPTSLIESTSRIDANAYNHAEFNSVDVHENLFLSHSNERWNASFRTLFDRDTTRESEITNYGSTLARVYSNRIAAVPSLSFKQNDSDTWSLRAAALHNSYSDNSYIDYNFYTLSPSFEHTLDPHNTVRISLNGQRYETDSGPSASTNSVGPSIGWTNKATNHITLHADGGALYSNKSGANANLDDNKWDYVFSAGVTYKGMQDDFDITAMRAQQPFGNGTETLLNSLTAKGNHRINDVLALNGKAIYRKADYPSAQPGINLDREYSVGTGLTYKIMKQVDLIAGYTYHNETLINAPGTVNEHVVMLSAALHPSWSLQ